MLERVFTEQPVLPFVRDVAEQVLAGERDDELVYAKRVRKASLDRYTATTPPHVQAARKLAEQGIRVGPVVRYVRHRERARSRWCRAARCLPAIDRRYYVDHVLRADRRRDPDRARRELRRGARPRPAAAARPALKSQSPEALPGSPKSHALAGERTESGMRREVCAVAIVLAAASRLRRTRRRPRPAARARGPAAARRPTTSRSPAATPARCRWRPTSTSRRSRQADFDGSAVCGRCLRITGPLGIDRRAHHGLLRRVGLSRPSISARTPSPRSAIRSTASSRSAGSRSPATSRGRSRSTSTRLATPTTRRSRSGTTATGSPGCRSQTPAAVRSSRSTAASTTPSSTCRATPILAPLSFQVTDLHGDVLERIGPRVHAGLRGRRHGAVPILPGARVRARRGRRRRRARAPRGASQTALDPGVSGTRVPNEWNSHRPPEPTAASDDR